MHRLRWRLTAVAATLVTALSVAPAASGHAVLLETEPANEVVLDDSPQRVRLRFDEPVETALGSIRVYDGSGKRVDAEDITRPSPREVAVAIGDELARGTYTVTWRAISDDQDPISGAFVFHVQEPGPQPTGIAAEVLEDTPFLVSALYTGGRFFDFLFLLLCAGGVAALVYPLRSADDRVHRRLFGLLAVFAGALGIVAFLGIFLQGAAAGGTGLGEAISWDVFSSVLDTRFGQVSLVRIGLALALLALALALRRTRPESRIPLLGAAMVVAAGMIVTPSLSGHASANGGLAFVSDYAHVLAAAAWVGGLAFVVIALVLALEERWPLATRSVPRFSNMAVAAVILLLVAGTVNGFLQVRTWRGLWETEYGLLLLAKITLVIPLLALGAYNNKFAVPRLRAGIASVLERRRFLQTAGVELAIMVGIVGVTAVLVNAPPAKSELEMHGRSAGAATVDFGEIQAHVMVEPAEVGANEIHIEFTGAEAHEIELQDVRVFASLPSRDIGPLRFEARPGGEHAAYVVNDASFGLAGEWRLTIEARRGEFELLSEETTITIR